MIPFGGQLAVSILLFVTGALALTVPLQCWRQHLLPSSPCSCCNFPDVTVFHVFSKGFPSRSQEGNIASCEHLTVNLFLSLYENLTLICSLVPATSENATKKGKSLFNFTSPLSQISYSCTAHSANKIIVRPFNLYIYFDTVLQYVICSGSCC